MASYDTEPCYCTQASTYEDLLNRVLAETTKSGGYLPQALKKEIETTIGEYQDAQEKYANDDSDILDDDEDDAEFDDCFGVDDND